jgi:hypothetical protein
LWQNAIEDAAKHKEDEDGDESGAPSTHEKSRKDEVSNKAKHDGTGADVEGTRTADEPGAESADEPHRGEGGPWMIMAVPKEECEEDQEREGIGDKMGEIGMEQGAEGDAKEAGNGAGHDAQPVESERMVLTQQEVNEFDEK